MPNIRGKWNIIDEPAPDHQLATLFSTKLKAGIETRGPARRIRQESEAFQKQKAQAIL